MRQARSLVARYDNEHPHTAGRVRQTLGGLLVADALVGLENPMDGRRTRAGILGAVMAIAFGAIFVFAGSKVGADIPETDSTTQGVITDVFDTGDTCGLRAAFTVNGQEYSARTFLGSSGNCGKAVGNTVEVHYNSRNPLMAYAGGGAGWFSWAFIGTGLLIALGGLVTFLIRLACLISGALLWRSGSAMVRSHPATQDDSGIVAEAARQLRLLRGRGGIERLITGAIAASNTATSNPATSNPATSPATSPTTTTATRVSTPVSVPGTSPVAPPVAPPPAPAPAAIAAGWYATADGRFLRWHDGTRWTDHVRPSTPTGG